MFERLTDRGRQVMAQATKEAQRLNHDYIGTEHILLAIINNGSGAGTHVLNKLGVDPIKARMAVEQLIKTSPPIAPHGRNVVGLAIEEAREMKHNYVGTEHLLLGILREGQGVGWQALEQLGVSADNVRRCVREIYMDDPQTGSVAAGEPSGLPRQLSLRPLPDGRVILRNENNEWVSGPMEAELAQEIVKRYNAYRDSS